jgi:hypothetical protein
MGYLTSTNKSPYKYIADIFQKEMPKFTKDLKKRKTGIVVGRTMRRADPKPSFYFTPSKVLVKQSGIADQKTIIKDMYIFVMYYTDDMDEDLFIIEQIITQIIVGNNKVSDTKQYKNTGQEFMQLKTFEYEYVYDGEANLDMKSVWATVIITFQDSYYNN